jgi:hypothetical protein
MSSKSLKSNIANNVLNGTYIMQRKWNNFGSVIEDSIFAQQREFQRKLVIIQQAKQDKLNKKK